VGLLDRQEPLLLSAYVAQDTEECREGEGAFSIWRRKEETGWRHGVQACCGEGYLPLALLISWHHAANQRVERNHGSQMREMGGEDTTEGMSDNR
jgi:hypothetical protein